MLSPVSGQKALLCGVLPCMDFAPPVSFWRLAAAGHRTAPPVWAFFVGAQKSGRKPKGFRPLKRKTRLLTQTQFGDQSTIALHVLLLQVSQQVAALANHLQQATTAVMVVVVGSQMLVQVVDASGQQATCTSGEPVSFSLIRYCSMMVFLDSMFLTSFYKICRQRQRWATGLPCCRAYAQGRAAVVDLV